MTPIELLEDVKSRFSVLLYNDEKALLSLLRKALVTYMDKAGFIASRRYKEIEEELTLPDDFLARICLKDHRNRFITSTVYIDNEERVLTLRLTGNEETPLVLTYMIDATRVDLDTWQIPTTAYGLIADYLELLISIPNSERLRRVSIAGKLDATDIPASMDLMSRKIELETAIAMNRAIIPAVSIGG
ncbi:hypothetical protein [Photobacterium leiognathi]|uniref:hypothetical protein n=1 Tax=Photobacterium leiognathi TaxID=553611 RepID=UPI002981DB71|nr:hypothetical protein [Photobacterium leiognathi]